MEQRIKELGFRVRPRKYQYAGEGFEYLRGALETKFERPLEIMAAEMLFVPLQMGETRFVLDERFDESRFAVGYDQKGNAYPVYKHRQANAADDLLTTVEDYGKFTVPVLKAEGLTKDVFADMTSRHVKTKGDNYFGLG